MIEGLFSIHHPDEFLSILESMRFPSHAVILRPLEWLDKSIVFKGIQTVEEFQKAFQICQKASLSQRVRVDTDMRAHMNPTRMALIKQLAKKLALRLTTGCPSCNMPGWGKVGVKKGLECGACELPTENIRQDIWGCVTCSFKEYVDREEKVDPENCLYCNP